MQVFDVTGKFLFKFGGYGAGPGQFDCIAGLEFDSAGCLVVCDSSNERLQVLTTEGRFLNEITNIDGHFFDMTGLCVGSKGQILLTHDHTVEVFNVKVSLAREL